MRWSTKYRVKQVSQITVRWTPETSGRVKHIEIQSRLVGTSEWTEQAGAFDPAIGEFKFSSNAPSSDVEVRCRYLNTDNIPGDWFAASITTAPAVVSYGEVTGTPTKLGDINGTEGTKLGGIAPGATVGGTIGTNIRNPDGSLYVPPSQGDLVDTVPPGAPSNLNLSSTLTDRGAKLRAEWTAPTDSDLAGFDVGFRENGGNEIIRLSTSAIIELDVGRNVPFSVRVRAYDRAGNRSGWTAVASHTTARDTVPPSPPSSVSVSTSFSTAAIVWTNPADSDLDRVQVVLYNSIDTAIDSRMVSVSPAGASSVIWTELARGTTYKVRLTAIDTSGNASTATAATTFATTSGLDVNAIPDSSITVNKLNATFGGGNLVRNSSFEDGSRGFSLYNNHQGDGTGRDVVITTNGVGRTGGKALELSWSRHDDNLNGFYFLNDNLNLFRSNQMYVVTFYAKGSGGAIGREISSAWNKGPNINERVGDMVVTNDWKRFTFRFKWTTFPVDPNGFFGVQPSGNVAGGILFDDVQVQEGDTPTSYAPAFLDGEVTADKIAAASITEIKIKDDSISAPKLKANSVTANKIDALAVTTGKLDALAVTAEKIASNAVIARTIKAGEIETDHLKVDSLNGDRISAGTLDAAKIKANTILSNTITVSGRSDTIADAYRKAEYSQVSGTPTSLSNINSGEGSKLSGIAAGATVGAPAGTLVGSTSATTVESNAAVGAQDPVTRINANTTVIDPGKILVSGSTTLADWRQPGDVTKISGGSISANTIGAERLKVGNRGLGFIGLNFEWNPVNNYVYWSEGYIYYIDNNGNQAQDYIAAGNSGGAAAHLWFCWSPGAGITYSQVNPAGNDKVLICAWWGGSNLNATYGGTIINGDRITTNTIDANRIKANTILASSIQVSGRSDTIADAYRKAEYAQVSGTPTSLSGINSSEGSKLSGIAAGATVGAPSGTTVGGTLAETVASNAATGAQDPATRINAGVTTINGGRITTKTIGADQINVATLDAVSANIGLLRTATSGQRQELDSNSLRIYDSNNVLRVRIGII